MVNGTWPGYVSDYVRNIPRHNPEVILGAGVAGAAYYYGNRNPKTYLKIAATTLVPTFLDYAFGQRNWTREAAHFIGDFAVDSNLPQTEQDKQRRRIREGLSQPLIDQACYETGRFSITYDLIDTLMHGEINLPHIHLGEGAQNRVSKLAGGFTDFFQHPNFDVVSLPMAFYIIYRFNPEARSLRAYADCIEERKETLLLENFLETMFSRIFPSLTFRTGEEIYRRAERYATQARN